MASVKKYLIRFIGEALAFMGILFLIDWASDQLRVWYMYLLQGLLFGLFMTFYYYWSDKRKKNKGDVK